MTGFVPGGMQQYHLPSPIDPGALAVHATGRLNTMSEILAQATCLRARDLANRATGYGGASFQDVKGDYSGTNRIAAAHRALFALHLDGVNPANLPRIGARPQLRQMLRAPQSRTDLVIRPVNYADQLLENAVSPDIFRLIESTLLRQAPGRPIEKSLLIDSMFRLQQLLHVGFDQAAATYGRRQRERGWTEFRSATPSTPAPLAGVSDREIDKFLDNAFERGGMSIHVAGPTHYGDLPETILGLSQEITDKSIPELSRPGNLDALIDSVDTASKDA
ncbi:hypothetical protein [Bosea sp. BK604]|uniref:hypothetical protein n=1 Tax=Bosea sp. BK604 TaxID=2512180 RepID=UPI001053A648|nr:hypothetical protein [Bosea sp. BK604]